MKKKLLIYANTMCIGGIEKSLINLLKSLDNEKYIIDLVLESKEGELLDEIPLYINISQYKVFKYKFKLLQKTLNFFNQIIWFLKNNKKYNCAILYTPYSLAGNFCVRAASTNKIIYIHSDYTNIYNENDFKNFFESRNITDYENIIFVSNESKNNFLKYYPNLKSKTEVINNIINYKEIQKNCEEKIKEHINKKDINLLYVGRLEEDSKRISIQLKLVKDLIKEIPNLKLYIVGTGVDENMYKNYIISNKLEKHIIMLGNKNNPYPYIKKSDYVILTSKYEGYPVVITESIVLKTDVISTIKVSDEIFEIGNNYGFLISKEYQQMKFDLKNIILSNQKNINDFNFEKINKNRLEKLEKIINK